MTPFAFPDKDYVNSIPLRNKLIIVGVIALGFALLAFNVNSDKKKCEKYCQQEGFHAYSLSSSKSRATCHCYAAGQQFPSTSTPDFSP